MKMEMTGVMGCVPSVVGLIQANPSASGMFSIPDETQRNGPEAGTTNRFAPLNAPFHDIGLVGRVIYVGVCIYISVLVSNDSLLN